MSPACQRLVGELWPYAFKTLKKLLHDDQVPQRLKELGLCNVKPYWKEDHREAICGDEDVREELAASMIEGGLATFQERVISGDDWDSERTDRAAVPTYFVNGCLLHYPKVYRRWAKDRIQRAHDMDLERVAQVQQDSSLNIEDRDTVKTLLLQANHQVRPILSMLWLGFDPPEIAEQMQISRSTVDTRLYRYRQRRVIPMVLRDQITPPAGRYVEELKKRSLGTRHEALVEPADRRANAVVAPARPLARALSQGRNQ